MNKKIEKVLKNQNDNYIFPFLWMHGETEEVLREYMGAIYKSNIRAVCVESRPHPDFCGEKWWQDMDIILDEARKRNMQVWILDDSHFPTGFANNAMKEQPDTLCRQSICYRTYEPEVEETLCIGAEEALHLSRNQGNSTGGYPGDSIRGRPESGGGTGEGSEGMKRRVGECRTACTVQAIRADY